jgi:hypothetical protein
MSHTSGCNRADMVFALTIASLTRDGMAAFALLDEDVNQDITNALKMLMCYWAWLKHDTFWKYVDIHLVSMRHIVFSASCV